MGPKGRTMGYDKELRSYRAQNDGSPPQYLGHVSPVGSPCAKLTGIKRYLSNHNPSPKDAFLGKYTNLENPKIDTKRRKKDFTRGLEFAPPPQIKYFYTK